jgi:hypothetical protein
MYPNRSRYPSNVPRRSQYGAGPVGSQMNRYRQAPYNNVSYFNDMHDSYGDSYGGCCCGCPPINALKGFAGAVFGVFPPNANDCGTEDVVVPPLPNEKEVSALGVVPKVGAEKVGGAEVLAPPKLNALVPAPKTGGALVEPPKLKLLLPPKVAEPPVTAPPDAESSPIFSSSMLPFCP